MRGREGFTLQSLSTQSLLVWRGGRLIGLLLLGDLALPSHTATHTFYKHACLCLRCVCLQAFVDPCNFWVCVFMCLSIWAAIARWGVRLGSVWGSFSNTWTELLLLQSERLSRESDISQSVSTSAHIKTVTLFFFLEATLKQMETYLMINHPNSCNSRRKWCANVEPSHSWENRLSGFFRLPKNSIFNMTH